MVRGRDQDVVADLALLRRIVVGLQEDQANPRTPKLLRARIDGALVLVEIVASRHPEATRAGSKWALAMEHIRVLCDALEAQLDADGKPTGRASDDP